MSNGSTFYNCKSQHSFNLFTFCDAQYRFTFLDIGAERRQNDGGVFRNNKLDFIILLEDSSLQTSPTVVGVNSPTLLYVIMADKVLL
ncbi:hypothetical protein P5V15_001234 [Pogonomyrmex californicus]